MDRFFDDTNIKKKKLQNTADKIRGIKQKVANVKEQVDNLPDDIKEKLIQQAVNMENIPVKDAIDNEPIPLDNNIKEPPKKKRGRKKKVESENVYQQDIQNILDESPELTPEPNGTKINIEATLKQPVYNVTREKGKIKAETENFINQSKNNKENDREAMNKEILINKQNETNNELASMQIELEIISRMKLQIDDKLKPVYDGKITKIQMNIKELELRAATIANLIAGR